MSILRRTMFARLFLLAFPNLLLASRSDAFAETYQYDALGRVIRVTYPGGETIEYTYDKAGNRTQVVRSGGSSSPPPPPPPAFNATIAVSGPAPVNLRTFADNAGYNGAQNANVTFEVNSGVTITGAAGAPNGGMAIDSGVWPTGSHAISINLVVKTGGAAHAGGGRGGAGGNQAAGSAGGGGGDAIYCRLPMSVTVQSGAEIKSGGGGGGGGGAASFTFPGGTGWVGGGGGGEGYPNGPGGAGGVGVNGGGSGLVGAAGTLSGGGAGGGGGPPGGAGGNAGASGTAGTASATTSGGAGGTGGHAIRKNGHTVNVTNNGAIAGAVG